MCLGIPMQVKSFPAEGKALCSGRGKTESLNILLVPPLKEGDWVLAWNGMATEKLTQERARQVDLALDALEQALSGNAGFADDAFADILSNTGKLPPHLADKAGVRH